MKPFPANKNENGEFSLLPVNIGQALKFLVMLSEKMITVAERETQVLIQNDLTAFSILQDEKENPQLTADELASTETTEHHRRQGPDRLAQAHAWIIPIRYGQI